MFKKGLNDENEDKKNWRISCYDKEGLSKDYMIPYSLFPWGFLIGVE